MTIHVHLTDQTLGTGSGVVRVEPTDAILDTGGVGPLWATQLADLVGHPSLVDVITIKPVVDPRDRISVDAYEIPSRVRDRVRLRYPVCVFPWCNRPVGSHTSGVDLDHVVPYDRAGTGPPGQTGTETLAPGCRFHHRVKTHGGWRCQRRPDGAFVWTSPHGQRYLVDHTGTHRTV